MQFLCTSKSKLPQHNYVNLQNSSPYNAHDIVLTMDTVAAFPTSCSSWDSGLSWTATPSLSSVSIFSTGGCCSSMCTFLGRPLPFLAGGALSAVYRKGVVSQMWKCVHFLTSCSSLDCAVSAIPWADFSSISSVFSTGGCSFSTGSFLGRPLPFLVGGALSVAYRKKVVN